MTDDKKPDRFNGDTALIVEDTEHIISDEDLTQIAIQYGIVDKEEQVVFGVGFGAGYVERMRRERR